MLNNSLGLNLSKKAKNKYVANFDLDELYNAGDVLDISTVENTPRAVVIRGLKMWFVGSQNAIIYEYHLTVSGRVRDAIYSGNSLDCSSFESNPSSLTLSRCGMYMLVGGFTSDSVHTIELATANTLDGASRNASKTLDISAKVAGCQGISLSNGDLKLNIIDATTDSIYRYTVDVTDISSGTYEGVKDISSIESAPQDIYFLNDEKAIIIGTETDSINALDVRGDISNWSKITGNDYNISTVENTPRGLWANNNGTRIAICGSETGEIKTLNIEYSNYRILQGYEVDGVDYQINTQSGTSAYCAIAIHGGGIERGSQETQEAFQTLTGYQGASFEGLKSSGNFVMHITSVKFDVPDVVEVVRNSDRCVSFHGVSGDELFTHVGGSYDSLRSATETELVSAGFTISEVPEYLDGKSRENIANKCVLGESLQLEISKGQRDLLRTSASVMTAFITAVKNAIDGL